MKIIKELSGNSGCKVYLFENDNIYFIRKISSSIEYNERLIAQIEKQKNALSSGIKSPLIIECGYKNKLFFADMEYVNGQSLASYFEQIPVTSIHNFIDSIIPSMDGNYTNNETNNIIKTKLNEIKNKILVSDENIENAFEIVNSIDWSNLPISYCHGDLTLENIIHKDGGFYCIDFLDSFVDSWIVDAAKLLQDFLCCWSYRNSTLSANLIVRLTVAKDYLIQMVEAINKDYVIYLYGMLIIHLLRILQYQSTDHIRLLVLNNISIVKSLLLKRMDHYE